jgi:hypothetical protein
MVKVVRLREKELTSVSVLELGEQHCGGVLDMPIYMSM